MLASSSKRAMSSTTTVTSLPFCAARSRCSISTESVPVRYTVILIATTCGSSAAALQHLDHRSEALEGMVEQDVLLADAGEDLVALGQHLGQAGLEGAVFQVRAVDPVGHLHQAHQVHDAGRAR
jgi:hypothetical protein